MKEIRWCVKIFTIKYKEIPYITHKSVEVDNEKPKKYCIELKDDQVPLLLLKMI